MHVKVRHAPLPAVMPGYWFKLGPGFYKINILYNILIYQVNV